ncbi:MAG TPA: tetratricopeptide repeat protein [Candidatus Angelobacter sp.]|nr:tetratricopeptide repeat protein [Candidatus Angelobacter sp.]
MAADGDDKKDPQSSNRPLNKDVAAQPVSNENDKTLSWYAAREPLVIVVLSLSAIAFFFLVSGLSGLYQRTLSSRASLWSARGENNLSAGRVADSINDFQVALTYSRDNFDYELSLAQALLKLKRTEEARVYLISLWQRQPENGSVNLQLARIYAGKGDVTQALRYYHNAIYAVWSGNAEAQQLSTRLELVRFLLDHKAFTQAEAELIAVGRNLPENPSLQVGIADLFMRVPDYDRALLLYRRALRFNRRNPDVLTRVGRAAFELGQYKLAERYLKAALAERPGDAQSGQLLATCTAVQKLDPYNFWFSRERDRMVLSDFATAGTRLNSCLSTASAAGNPALQALHDQWTDMKSTLNRKSLRVHPDLSNSVMDLVFNIERETSSFCGSPTGDDQLLLLIAKRHEGS